MFNRELALELAKLSKLIYSGYTDIKKKFHNTPEEDNWQFFDSKGSQGLIVEYPDKIYVAFRGTGGDEGMTVGDFLSDINVKQCKIIDIGKVHLGFYNALQNIKTDMLHYLGQIEQKIFDNAEKMKPIYFTGHSLGGALATLFLLEYENNWDGLYTFGSPRVGNKEFAYFIDSHWKHKIFRVVNDRDYVTRIPTRLMGYDHVGQLIFLDNEGKINFGESAAKFWNTFWQRANSGLEDIKKLQLIRGGITDHAINNYIQVLENVA